MTEAPYSKVALPSGAQVSSRTSSYPAIFFTRRLLRNPLPSRRPATNRTAARKNAACWLGVSESKSLRKLGSRSKAGTLRSGRREVGPLGDELIRARYRGASDFRPDCFTGIRHPKRSGRRLALTLRAPSGVSSG